MECNPESEADSNATQFPENSKGDSLRVELCYFGKFAPTPLTALKY